MELTMALCSDWTLSPGAGEDSAGPAGWFPLTRLSASEEGTEDTGQTTGGRAQQYHRAAPSTAKSQPISTQESSKKHRGVVCAEEQRSDRLRITENTWPPKPDYRFARKQRGTQAA